MQWTVINESGSYDQLPFNDLLAVCREIVSHSPKGTAVLSQTLQVVNPEGNEAPVKLKVLHFKFKSSA